MSVEVVYGKKQRAYITHVEKDGTFFIQLDTKEAYELSKLSERIEKYVCTSNRSVVSPEYGQRCFACSKSDATWYRALVTETHGNTVKVFYVDYGNTEELPHDQLCTAPESFFLSPFQSVCCSIANFLPGEAAFGTRLKSLILERETCCVLLSKNGSKGHPFLHFLPCYNVLLYENERSDVTLAEYLIKRNLGHYAICTDSVQVGTKQNVVVSFTDSPGKFWVQMSRASQDLEKLMENLNSPSSLRSLKVLPETAICEGVACCTQYIEDLRFYRVEILGRKSSTKVRVWFGDYGNTETVATKDLKVIPHKMTRTPFYAVMCGLDGVLPLKSDQPHPKLGHIAWTPRSSKEFSNIALEEEFVADFVSELSPEVYTVHLSNPNTGVDLGRTLANKNIVALTVSENSANAKTLVEFKYLSLEVGRSYEKIFITHVESPAIVWCQLPEFQTEMEALTAKLESVGPSLPTLESAEIGIPCCAQYSVDNSWYRGSVESVNFTSRTAQILFVDYGNTESMSLSNLKILPDECMSLPAQAISFSLATVAPFDDAWNEEACDYFVNLVQEAELNCQVIELDADDYPSVKLSDPQQPDSDIALNLVRNGFAIELAPTAAEVALVATPMLASPSHSQPILTKKLEVIPREFEYQSLEVGKSYKMIFITHVESPAVVWCQLPESQTEIEALTAKLESMGSSLPTLERAETGTPCCAQYSVDNLWYRGSIESVNSSTNTAQVLFVDYGNTEEINLSDLKTVPSEFLSLPAQAISFSLATIAPSRETTWSKEACDCFVNLIRESELNCQVIKLDADGYPSVMLSDPQQPDTDIAQQLVQLGYAVELLFTGSLTQNQEETFATPETETPLDFKYQTLDIGKSYSKIFITYVESPAIVWCQLPEFQAEMEALTAKLESVGSTLPNLERTEIATPCCAQYSVDNSWYRGSIESVNFSTKTAQVIFVDYGNNEQVSFSKLKTLPSACMSLPAQAISFSMASISPCSGTTWSKEACECFKNLVQDRELNCKAIELDADEYPSVQLYDPLQPSKDVGQELVRRGYAKELIPVYPSEGNFVKMVLSGAQLSGISPIVKSNKPEPDSSALVKAVVPSSIFPIKSLTKAVPCNVDSPFRFHLQLAKERENLSTFSDNINLFYQQNPGFKGVKPEVGCFCATQFSEDGLWYRAKITSVAGSEVGVEFIDYGNSETTTIETIKSLDLKFVSTPCFAVHCCLNGLSNDEISDGDCQTFCDMISDRTFTAEFQSVVVDDAIPVPVKLSSSSEDDILNAFLKTRNILLQPKDIPSLNPQMNATLPCEVTHIESCNEIYVQLLSENEQLTPLMDELYSFCEECTQSSDLETAIVGTYCAAPYSDGSWYRGLLTATTTQELAVFYLDYGNKEVVPINELRVLDPKFCNVPAQAIQCTLGDPQKFLSNDCKKFLLEAVHGHKDVTVTFYEFHVNKYKACLRINGKDICQLLEENGLTSQQLQISRTEPSLGEPLVCTISFVNNCTDFYCQLTSESEPFSDLMEKLYNVYEVQSEGVPLSSPIVGSYCAAPYTDEGSWYRALVSDISEQNVTVSYIDYGNSNTLPLSRIFQLNKQFYSLPMQAIRCSLGFVDKRSVDNFEDRVLEQEVEITFIKQLPNHYEVRMIKDGISIGKYPTEYTLSTATSRPHEVPQIKTLSPELDNSIVCNLSFIASCDEFYCQLSTYDSQLHDLMNNLYSFYGEQNNGTVLAEPGLGSYCAVPFSDDGSWYRGVITDLSTQSASVFYMDYGNMGEVEVSKLMHLEPQFHALPIQALQCSLPPQYSNENCTKAFQELLEQLVETTFCEQLPTGSFMTTIKVDGKGIEDILAPYAAPSPLHIPNVSPECGLFQLCTVTFLLSCDEFYCQLSSESAQFDNLMNKLNAYYAESGERKALDIPSVGSLCATCDEKGWYRAKIIALSQENAEVLYVDYGNQATLPLSAIMELEPQFLGMKAQAVKCCLRDFAPKDSVECLAMFQELVLQSEVKVMFEPPLQSDSYLVVMEINGRNITELFAEAGLAQTYALPSKTSPIWIPTISLHPDSTWEVLVTAVNTFTEFYCQKMNAQDELEILKFKMRSFCEESPQSSDWYEGEYALAKFSEDDEWYRAQISKLTDSSMAKVFYVDYGNSEVVNIMKLRKIDIEFCQLPSQAIRCALNGSQHYPYSGKNHEQWNGLLLDQEMKLKCVSVTSAGTHMVDLETVDTCVDVFTQALTMKIVSPQMVDPAVELSETNIGSQANTQAQIQCIFPADLKPNSFHDVLVQHVESPALFYSHFGHFHAGQLQNLMNVMQDFYTSGATSLQPVNESSCTKGCFLAAQFSDDDLWYRCLVESVSSVGIKVRFVDYGNTEVVLRERLHFLDPEFVKLPAQGIPCSLAGISPKGSDWSEEIIEKLAELVLNKTIMGQVKTTSDHSLKHFQYSRGDTLKVGLIDNYQTLVNDQLINLGLANSTCEGQITSDTTLSILTESAPEESLVYREFLMVAPGECCEMYVSHIVSPAQFWLQMPTADDMLAILQTELAEAYEGVENMTLVDHKNACCAKFSQDGDWYRAAVQNASSDGLNIYFVDYGNSEIVDPSQVLLLQPRFLETPVQAIECSLAGIPDIPFTEETLARFSSLVMDKELLVTFKKQLKHNKWEVIIQENGQLVGSSLFSTLPTTDGISETLLPVTIPSLEIKVGESYPVYIAFSDSPSKFFCQLESEIVKLKCLMSEVGEYYKAHYTIPELTPGSFCVAQHSDMGTFYRAQITAVHSDSDIEVVFVDYGNSEHISLQQISCLEPRFAQLCAQGIPCSLVQDYTMDYSSEIMEQFFQYDLNQVFKIKIRAHHEGRYIVDLYDQEGSHINADVLRMLSPSRASSVKRDSYLSSVFPIHSSIQAYISHVNSPTSFYCQPLEKAAELESIMSLIPFLRSANSLTLSHSDLIPGKICLAQYDDDNEWYRALVKEVTETEVTVLFVDYGNTETTTADKIVDLPQQLQEFVVQAIHCSVFDGLDPDMRWKEEHISMFQELVCHDVHVNVKVTSVSSSGQYFVELSTNGESIDFTSILEQQVEETVITDPQPPLRSLTAGPADLLEFSEFTAENSAPSSASQDTESVETESDSGSVGAPLIKAPYKISLAVAQESLDVNVVFVQSPSLIYIQRADCQTELDNLSEEIKQYCANFGDSHKEFSLTFRQGDYVLAKYSVDDVWYRAEVTGVDSEDGTSEVCFVDHGNVEIISADDLLMCPENLLELPAQAIPCSLAQVPRRDSWPSEYKELITNLVKGRVLRATVVLPASQGMRSTIKLEDMQTSTDLSEQVLLKLQDEFEVGSNDVIVELPEGECLDESPVDLQPGSIKEIEATMPGQDGGKIASNVQLVSLLQERKFEIGSTHTVSLLNCESPHSFVCKLTNEADLLESVTVQLAELSTNFLCELPKEGDILAAQFSEDSLWYRARVEGTNSEGATEVTFIDYGNSEALAIDKLRFLSTDLLSCPPLAFECFLSGIETYSAEGVFHEDATSKFLECVGEEVATIEVVSLDSAGHLGVVLITSTGLNVGHHLIKCEVASPLTASPETGPKSFPDKMIDGSLVGDNEEPVIQQEDLLVTDKEPAKTDTLVTIPKPVISLPDSVQETSKLEGESMNSGPPTHSPLQESNALKSPCTPAPGDSADQESLSVDYEVTTHSSNESNQVFQEPSSRDLHVAPPVNSNGNNNNGMPTITNSSVCENASPNGTLVISAEEFKPQNEGATPLCFTLKSTNGNLDEKAENYPPTLSADNEKTDPLDRVLNIMSNTNDNETAEYASHFSEQVLLGSKHKVKVLSLSSPDEFVCVFTEHTETLKQITAEMKECSNLSAVEFPTSGLPVATFNTKHNEWHRGVVCSQCTSVSMVKVYFVDSGVTDLIQLSKLKHLTKRHAEILPPQALKCHIRVLSETDLNSDLVAEDELWELTWPISCTQYLCDLTQSNDDLYIEIIAITDNQSYEVMLLDCSTYPPVDLREKLVSKLCERTHLPVLAQSVSTETVLDVAQDDIDELFGSKDILQLALSLDSMTIQPPLVPESVTGITSSANDEYHTVAGVLPMSDQTAPPESRLSVGDDSNFVDGEKSAFAVEGDKGTEESERICLSRESNMQLSKGDQASKESARKAVPKRRKKLF